MVKLWHTTAHVMLSFPYISKLIKDHQHHYSSQLVCNTSHGEYAPGPGIADAEDAAEDTERSLGVDGFVRKSRSVGYVIVPWRAIFHLYIEHICMCLHYISIIYILIYRYFCFMYIHTAFVLQFFGYLSQNSDQKPKNLDMNLLAACWTKYFLCDFGWPRTPTSTIWFMPWLLVATMTKNRRVGYRKIHLWSEPHWPEVFTSYLYTQNFRTLGIDRIRWPTYRQFVWILSFHFGDIWDTRVPLSALGCFMIRNKRTLKLSQPTPVPIGMFASLQYLKLYSLENFTQAALEVHFQHQWRHLNPQNLSPSPLPARPRKRNQGMVPWNSS